VQTPSGNWLVSGLESILVAGWWIRGWRLRRRKLRLPLSMATYGNRIRRVVRLLDELVEERDAGAVEECDRAREPGVIVAVSRQGRWSRWKKIE
jgi:hypothetical protein